MHIPFFPCPAQFRGRELTPSEKDDGLLSCTVPPTTPNAGNRRFPRGHHLNNPTIIAIVLGNIVILNGGTTAVLLLYGHTFLSSRFEHIRNAFDDVGKHSKPCSGEANLYGKLCPLEYEKKFLQRREEM